MQTRMIRRAAPRLLPLVAAALFAMTARAGEYLPDRIGLRPLRLAPLERVVNEQMLAAHAALAGMLGAGEVAIPRGWRLVNAVPLPQGAPAAAGRGSGSGGATLLLVFQDAASGAVHALAVTGDGFVLGSQGFTVPAR
jgi:hypothetical protein